MRKLFSSLLVAFSFITAPLTVLGQSSPAFELKNMKMTQVNDTKIEVIYGKETVTLEKLNARKFKVNGQTLLLKKSDSPEVAMQKIKRAYRASKKNAFLTPLLINEAEAAPPLLFTALFGGLLGFGLGQARCRKGGGNNFSRSINSQ